MLRNHILSSGTIIRQDFTTAVRFVFFDTGLEEWAYATDGGTAFVINFRGKPYALTARHVLQSFTWPQLIITEKKIGTKIAGIKAVYHPSSPNPQTTETDVLDVLLIEFRDEVGLDFFEDSAYIVDPKTICTSQDGHNLLVAGVLKAKSEISETDITPQFCQLGFLDNGPTRIDPTVRYATAEFMNPGFTEVTGLSGSPVYDLTANALCGMVVRGGMNGNRCSIIYVDMFDIYKIIQSVREDKPNTNYVKNIAYRVRRTDYNPSETDWLAPIGRSGAEEDGKASGDNGDSEEETRK
jgi:hypothetical protein